MHIPDQHLIRALMDARLNDAQSGTTPGRSGDTTLRVWARLRDRWHSVVDRATRPPPGVPRGDPLSHGPGH